MWLVNGKTVVNGTRYKLIYDGMYHLDIPKTRQYDNGIIEVVARSSCGEAIETTELKVVPRTDDFRGVLKNSPRREYSPSLDESLTDFYSLQNNSFNFYDTNDSYTKTSDLSALNTTYYNTSSYLAHSYYNSEEYCYYHN